MSSSKPPVGRLDPKIYRRRRAVLLLGLLIVIAVVVLIVVRPGSGHGAPGASAPVVSTSPATAPAVSPNPTVIPTTKASADGDPCDPKNIDVEALTDASSYGADQQPLLSLSLTNTGPNSCTIDAGTGQQVYTITSGTETYWTSTDCQTGPVSTVILLKPGKTLTSTPIPWDRTRSSKTTCSGARPPVPAGGASYHLKVSLDGVASKTTKQFLLN